MLFLQDRMQQNAARVQEKVYDPKLEGFRGQDGNLDVWSSLGASDGFGGQILLQACLLHVPQSLGSPACTSQVPENPANFPGHF